MKFFLDSAKIDEIKEAYNTFGIDGVTTNPNHIMNSGKSFYDCLKDLRDFVKENNIEGYEKFPISVEINPHLDNADEIVKEASEIASICKNFCIKIPCTSYGVEAARKLEAKGIRTNLTLVFSASQALYAAKAGSLFVSPFIGWKESSGDEALEYIYDIVDIYKNYGFYGKTEIICAAVRTGHQIVECAKAGADIITCGLQVYKDFMYHPFTDYGLKKFQSSWDKTITDKKTL